MVKEYLRNKLAGFEHEVFAVLFLDTRHQLIEYREMFHGTIDSASVYPREVVKEALRLNAAAVILLHNHPSGNPEPSQVEKMLTQRLKEALGLVEVRMLDEVIVAGAGSVGAVADLTYHLHKKAISPYPPNAPRLFQYGGW
ncbi:hypothetical protein ERL64_16340 [Hafnia alvei]|nr:hypothetical protein ERL64_16340 [Hafnia alvei]